MPLKEDTSATLDTRKCNDLLSSWKSPRPLDRDVLLLTQIIETLPDHTPRCEDDMKLSID